MLDRRHGFGSPRMRPTTSILHGPGELDEHTRSVEVQRFLAWASEELASSLDYEATLRRLARLAVPRLADWCAVDLADEAGALVEGIAVQDPERRFLEINVAAERIFGLPRDQIVDHYAPDLPIRAVYEDGSPMPAHEHPVAMALRTGQAQVGRVMGIHRTDGTLVWISLNSQPLLEPDGHTVVGVVSSFFDITERKQRAELEQQLIGIVSHDLRTPLSTILHGAEALLLRESSLGDDIE